MQNSTELKTNDVINWFVVDRNAHVVDGAYTRDEARNIKNEMTDWNDVVEGAPFRIAKLVVTK